MADQSASTPSNDDPKNNPDVVPANNDNPTPPAGGEGGSGKRKAPSRINQKYLDEITLIRDLLPAARDASRTAALTEGDWDPARIAALWIQTPGILNKLETLGNYGLRQVARDQIKNGSPILESLDLLLARDPCLADRGKK